MLRIILAAVALCTALATPAVADDPARSAEGPEAQAARAFPPASVDEEALALPTVSGERAEAFPLPRIGVFAEKKILSVGRRALEYDIEGGASLRLHEGLHLTGSYRLLGFEFTEESSGPESHVGGAFLGLTLLF